MAGLMTSHRCPSSLLATKFDSITIISPPHSSSSSSSSSKLPVSCVAPPCIIAMGAGADAGPDAAPGTSGGDIQRLVLSQPGRTKLNPSSDRDFYSFPRFVTHVDDAFLSSLTQLYRERIPPNSQVLDLMSSWVSHLPPEVPYKHIVGHGLNAAELARNKRLDTFFVKDLNAQGPNVRFEAADGSFDAVLCAVSVQYLQHPEKVFAEIYRMLRPGGVCIVSFSNRMFYEKAVAAWRDGTMYSRTQLVVQYFTAVAGFTQPEVIKKLPSKKDRGQQSPVDWLLGLLQPSQEDPFYAVISYRNFKPI